MLKNQILSAVTEAIPENGIRVIEQVPKFTYLGINITGYGAIKATSKQSKQDSRVY